MKSFKIAALASLSIFLLIGTTYAYLNEEISSEAPAELSEAYKAIVQVKTYSTDEYEMLTLESVGSGVVINPLGIVLTNYHVVSSESEYDDSEYSTAFQICLTEEISKSPNCNFSASLIAKDKDKDTALLQIIPIPRVSEIRVFPYLELDPSDHTEISDELTAIGYPDIGQETITITRGIISGKIQMYDKYWIKTDAITSFGSSGGAALDESGKVIGITTQIYSDVAGTLGYLLSASSIADWVNFHKTDTPQTSSLQPMLFDLSYKQKILASSNKFINLYPYFEISKPEGWTFTHESNLHVTITNKRDPDGGAVSVDLFKNPYLIDLGSTKGLLLRIFNQLGMSSVFTITKEKEVTINNVKGKLINYSSGGVMANGYLFPHREYLLWIRYNYGKNDKDKKKVDEIINSLRTSNIGPKFVEWHKYAVKNPGFAITTAKDWAILPKSYKANPIDIFNKSIKEAFVGFYLEKMDSSASDLDNDGFVEQLKQQNDYNNRVGNLIDYKYQIVKTEPHYKLSKEIDDCIRVEALEKTADGSKTLAYDTDYYIKKGDTYINVNLSVYTTNKKVYDKANLEFNKMLQGLSFK